MLTPHFVGRYVYVSHGPDLNPDPDAPPTAAGRFIRSVDDSDIVFYAAQPLIFYAEIRYRHYLMPLLRPFAGLALARLASLPEARPRAPRNRPPQAAEPPARR